MKIIKNLFLALLTIGAINSCSDDFFDVNESQDDPSDSTPQLTLPVAQVGTASYISGGGGSLNTLGNFWSYNWAAAGEFIFYIAEQQYNVTSGFRTGVFENAYLGPLSNYDYLENFGANSETGGSEYSNYKAIAKIMKAYHFQYLVDAYGDVPYTEAFGRGDNPTPAYDDAEFIYADIYEQLVQATNMISDGLDDETVLLVGDEDVTFSGDMMMWGKFANSIKLRILLRQSETNTDLSAKYDALSGNQFGFLGEGESAFVNPGYIQVAGKQNPLFNAFGETVEGNLAANAEAIVATDYIIEKLQDDFNDPRLDNLYSPSVEEGIFVGNSQNNNLATAPRSRFLSRLGSGVIKSFDQDAILMQSAESLFLQAEAVQRGFISGNAEDLYESAIEESFVQLDENDVSAMDYYSQPIDNVSWSNSDNKIEAIITQKWIALNGTGAFESWIEYRRTGYPSDLPTAPGALRSTIPVKLLYPSSEQATNPNNSPIQSVDDAFNSPVFWDN